jgi:phosphate transport system ATP-binding protein
MRSAKPNPEALLHAEVPVTCSLESVDPSPALENLPASTTVAFDIHDLNIFYARKQAVHDGSCRINTHAVTAIMGPSGCGKSTLLKVLNRTLELTPGVKISGCVLFHGDDLYADDVDPRSVRKTIGIIHQRPITFPMSILENVLFGAEFHRHYKRQARAEYAQRYLERVGLWEEVKDRLHDDANRLSGGQQQRLCLARTLANQPEAILLDEPCSALDPSATRHIEKHIMELRNDYPVVIVTHNVAQARRISDYVVFMYDGRIVETGRSEQVFSNPRSRLAEEFIAGRFG